MPRKEEGRHQGDVCIGYLLSAPWEDGTSGCWCGMVLVDLRDCGD